MMHSDFLAYQVEAHIVHTAADCLCMSMQQLAKVRHQALPVNSSRQPIVSVRICLDLVQ
jgi:hypothetical protein